VVIPHVNTSIDRLGLEKPPTDPRRAHAGQEAGTMSVRAPAGQAKDIQCLRPTRATAGPALPLIAWPGGLNSPQAAWSGSQAGAS